MTKLQDIVIFVLLFFGFTWLFFYNSGWSQLSQHYRTNQSPPTAFLKNQSGRIGRNLAMRGLNVGISSQSLYLSVAFPFSLIVPPLLIPWSAIIQIEPYDDYALEESYRLHIGNPTITTLILTKETLQQAEADSGVQIVEKHLQR